MDNQRLTKRIFTWDKHQNVRNWSDEICKLLTDIDLENEFYLNVVVDLKGGREIA